MRSQRNIRKMVGRVVGNKNITKPLRVLSNRGLLPQYIWTRLPAYGIVRIGVGQETSFLFSAKRNDFLDRCYFYRGLDSYEKETFTIFISLARKVSCVLDIGAHSGIYTLIACAVNPGVKVIAFEPIPYIWNNLVENIYLNGWENRCMAVCAAASERSGTGTLNISREREYFSSLDTNPDHGEGSNKIVVPTMAVDDIIHESEEVGLIKIDVEGHEYNVLLGARRMLSRNLPDIIIECTDREVCDHVQEVLDPLGYNYYHITGNGLVSMKSIIPDESHEFRNYLCVAGTRQLG